MIDGATSVAPVPSTHSAMAPVPYRVRSRVVESPDSATLCLAPVGEALRSPEPGEFMMLYAFGVGEAAISISGDPTVTDGSITHTIRAVGAVSRALHDAEPGTVVGVRGPFGTSWGLGRGRRPGFGHGRRRGGAVPVASRDAWRAGAAVTLRQGDAYRGCPVTG